MTKLFKLIGLLGVLVALPSCNPTEPASNDSEPTVSTERPDSSVSETPDSSVEDSTPDSSVEDSTGDSTPTVETYKIGLTVPTGITASLDKTEAAEGETVTLTINTIDAGYTITHVSLISYQTSDLTSTDGKTYTFTMPDRSVSIVIYVEVEGEVTLVGDVVAALTKNPETGIYEAKGVKVEGTSAYAEFSYQVNGKKLDSLDVDPFKCFADVSFVFDGDQSLQIATGCTYDFFYDPAASASGSCWIRRVSVDVLPNSADALYSLFGSNIGIRGEYTTNNNNLTAMDLKIRVPAEQILDTVTLKRYGENTILMNVSNELTTANSLVYKSIDPEAKTLTVIDNFLPSAGNSDNTRDSTRSSSAYSARYDLTEAETDNRFDMLETDAYHSLNTFAYDQRFIEGEIMDAYRVGFEDDEVSSSDIEVTSEAQADGGFTTTITSYVERDATAGTYTDEIHEGRTFAVTIGFSKAGSITSLSYTENKYDQTSWDFFSHKPAVGAVSTLVKQITGTWTYGGATEETLPATFDPSAYFISSFDKVRFFNDTLETKPGKTFDEDKSYLAYADKICFSQFYADEDVENLETVEFSPATALDLWQYGPTDSTDDSVITQKETDSYNEMSCVGIGDATVTFTNHTDNTGISVDVDFNVDSVTKFHSISLDWTQNAMIENTDRANIYAGETDEFPVIVTPDYAPNIFTASSSDERLKVSTEPGLLKVDASGFAGITEATTVEVWLSSDWADQSSFESGHAVIYITVLPTGTGPVGTWVTDDTYYPNTRIVFTDEAYTGTHSDDFDAPLKGYIYDNYDASVDEDSEETVNTTDTYYFYYEYKDGVIHNRIYDITTTGTSFGFTADDLTAEFTYTPRTDTLDLCLYAFLDTSTEESWSGEYVGIIGSFDEEGYFDVVSFHRTEEQA